jgi:hypothetical protein
MIPSLMNIFAAASNGLIGTSCSYPNSTFLTFPTWYHYLPSIWALASGAAPNAANLGTVCAPTIAGLSDIWLIVAAVVEILLRVAGLVAIGMMIYGGIEFITSQGEPEQTKRARETAINALIGLVIAIVAATLVTFIAGQFKSS